MRGNIDTGRTRITIEVEILRRKPASAHEAHSKRDTEHYQRTETPIRKIINVH